VKPKRKFRQKPALENRSSPQHLGLRWGNEGKGRRRMFGGRAVAGKTATPFEHEELTPEFLRDP